MKWILLILIVIISACSIHKDKRQVTKTKTLLISSIDLTSGTHFKNGNYIISVKESVGKDLINKFKNLQDSAVFKKDTIDLQLTDSYWTSIPVSRVLQNCFEINEVQIFSILERKYINKVARIVSKSKINDIHNYYIYTNMLSGDTILNSYSFDTGTPPF